MKWLLGLVGLILVLVLGAAYMTYPQPFLKARDAVGRHYLSELYPANGKRDAAVSYFDLPVANAVAPRIIMFASAGREVSDFNELATTLHTAGYPVTMIEAPGIGRSVASQETPNLFDLARDAHGIYAAEQQVIFLGHAFGNRVARASATLYDAQTAGVILIASGGQKPIAEKAQQALTNSFDPRLTISARTEAVRYAFFAEGNEIPDYWLRGWHAGTGRLQGSATRITASDDWSAGGTAPMLVIAGLQDTIAPPEDTIDLLEQAYPDRVTGLRLDGAGHALLPEKPNEIASAILDWLNQLPARKGSET
ncbi:MAG: alpha/beta hydrolase [Pseudomonadota bacterium]